MGDKHMLRSFARLSITTFQRIECPMLCLTNKKLSLTICAGLGFVHIWLSSKSSGVFNRTASVSKDSRLDSSVIFDIYFKKQNVRLCLPKGVFIISTAPSWILARQNYGRPHFCFLLFFLLFESNQSTNHHL